MESPLERIRMAMNPKERSRLSSCASRVPLAIRSVTIPGWLAGLLSSWIALGALAQSEPQPGLEVTFAHPASGQMDTEIRPNLWLYVPAGDPATPFLADGSFTAAWRGWVRVDLRGEYNFHAHLTGQVLIRVNGRSVVEDDAVNGSLVSNSPVRLNKGTNALEVIFQSPSSGDAWLRVEWSRAGEAPLPIPSADLSHTPTDAADNSARIRLGRELFAAHRCAKCHEVPSRTTAMRELSMDAPDLAGIGSRLNREWMARWIKNPGAERVQARMPQLFHGASAETAAEASAAFLSSLTEHASSGAASPAAGETAEGERLFSVLHCAACHALTDGSNDEPKKIPLNHVTRKFRPGALAGFLKQPQAHYASSPMPDFQLSPGEAEHLAAFLTRKAAPRTTNEAPASPDQIERGRLLVQTSGCLNCHPGPLRNDFRAKPLAELKAENWNRGCLADPADPGSKAPRFRFSAAERDALVAFARTDRASLARQVDADFAARQIRLLGCANCHGGVDGLPALDMMGGKLKPEWMESFLAGQIAAKPRPWLESRMPLFPKYAAGLARGLAARHGFASASPGEVLVDIPAAEIGRQLVSIEGGFACVTCHPVGKTAATLGSEGTGINLAQSHARLQRTFFERWLRNPVALDRTTKMPVYFDDQGRSPLIEIYEGDATRQIHALWEFIRLGETMSLPREGGPSP